MSPLRTATFKFATRSVASSYHFGHEIYVWGMCAYKKLTNCWTCRDTFNSPNVDGAVETSLRCTSGTKFGRFVAYLLGKNCYTIWRNCLELATQWKFVIRFWSAAYWTCIIESYFQRTHIATNTQYNNIHQKRLLSYLSTPINSGTAGDTTVNKCNESYISKTSSLFTSTYIVPS
jgi:hypothetical protein